MNDNLPAIEPVTERDIDEVLNARAAGYDIRYALEQDRRRVAERQARSYKREKDCATADDWRHRSRHLEAEWGRCSQQCAVMQGERDAARAEVAAHRKHDVLRCDALMKAEAEVAKLNAACAHRLEALRGANHRIIYGEWASDYSHSLFAAALSTDAGKGCIDATGAVEATVQRWEVRGAFGYFIELSVPADWAGSRVLIVPVRP